MLAHSARRVPHILLSRKHKPKDARQKAVTSCQQGKIRHQSNVLEN